VNDTWPTACWTGYISTPKKLRKDSYLKVKPQLSEINAPRIEDELPYFGPTRDHGIPEIAPQKEEKVPELGALDNTNGLV
jgi:hypothetical protein